MKLRDEPLETLVEADPNWVDTGPANTKDPNRKGIGVSFDCPIHEDCRIYVPFAQPLDGGSQFEKKGWRREGDTFEGLTLAPSIRIIPHSDDACAWHGFVRGGRLQTCSDSR